MIRKYFQRFIDKFLNDWKSASLKQRVLFIIDNVLLLIVGIFTVHACDKFSYYINIENYQTMPLSEYYALRIILGLLLLMFLPPIFRDGKRGIKN